MKEAVITFLYFLVIVGICFVGHTALASLFDWRAINEPVSLVHSYLLFSLGSTLVLTVVHIVYQRNKDIVGMSFLLVTMVKFILAGIIGRPLWSGDGSSRMAQWNFLALFLLFLAIETVLTIRILNKKQ